MTKVSLTPWEVEACEEIARRRNNPKSAAGIRSSYNKSFSDLDNHIEAVKAEYAVAKALGLELNFEFYGVAGDGGQNDLLFPGDGGSISVKYRRQRGHDFALDSNTPFDFKDDVGVLVWPTEDAAPNTFDIVGWISKEQFRNRDVYRMKNFTHGWRAVVEAHHMRPIEELITRINELRAQEALRNWARTNMPK